MKINFSILKKIIYFLFIIILDRYSKYLAIMNNDFLIFDYIAFINLIPFINYGFSFGIFSLKYEVLKFISFGIIFILLLIILLSAFLRFRVNGSIFYEIIILICACSNLIDRIIYGGVIDFICINTEIFPWIIVLNFADIFISIFSILLFLDWIKNSEIYIFENFYGKNN